MSRQYPIWNSISGQGKVGSADFGSRTGFCQAVFVGTSSSNSYHLCNFAVRGSIESGFIASINGRPVAELTFNGREPNGIPTDPVGAAAMDRQQNPVEDDYLLGIKVVD